MANGIDIIHGPVLAESVPWWRMYWNYSGRYRNHGGASVRATLNGRGLAGTKLPTLHNLDQPPCILRPAPAIERRDGGLAPASRLYFTLHIDIDRSDPLNVVSGTVAVETLLGFLRGGTHFIGQVTSNTANAEGRALVVENFSFTWPETRETIDRIEIQLTPSLPSASLPSAAVTFFTTARRSHGPYTADRSSAFFREVEVEVDREEGAIDPEPYDTHTHPDRPEDFPRYRLTLEAAYYRAGIGITRSSAETSVLDSAEAGADERWTEMELHDSMEAFWSAFANRSQWKMWVFLAKRALERDLAGIMFDAYIDEPGGVDRQGTAIFTQCPALYAEYATDNAPDADEAIERELFTLLIHEPGHAFNLYHPWSKTADLPWEAPAWMPATNVDLALTWMNYPWRASRLATGVVSLNVQWFYERFEFRFDDLDTLFLRHAPERDIIMGGEEFGVDHGLLLRSSLDPSLELLMHTTKKIFELGEPVTLELSLKNIGDRPVTLLEDFDLRGGLLRLAVTDPQGKRRPFLPFVHRDTVLQQRTLAAGEAFYLQVRLAVGLLGCPFKEPGAYRIEASYHNPFGGSAAAVKQLYVRPPANFDDLPIIHELFSARIGRVLYVGGSRVMEDVNDKLKWVAGKLGKNHPAQFHITQALAGVFAHPHKLVQPETKKIKVLKANPEYVEKHFRAVIAKPEAAADSLGHLGYEKLVNTYVDSAVEIAARPAARKALEEMIAIFRKRNVSPAVIEKADQRLTELK
jgi:hypothetical protein